MIRPKNNKVIHWLFHHYIMRIIRANFHGVKYNAIDVSADKSVLLLANHFGWWDGFVMYYLNHKLFKKKFHIMILEDTVRKVWFLKYMGAFSIVKNSRQMIASLNYAAELLKTPGNLVLIFPQGRLYSNFVDTIHFEKGLSRVTRGNESKAECIFAASFIENFEHKKPGINIYLQKHTGETNLDLLVQAFQRHYHTSKLLQAEIVI
jgi:1-acyl-sn-glycerol-3-phosphate acyltransferase